MALNVERLGCASRQLELQALRDLIQRVLEPTGRAAEASSRVQAVLAHIDATEVRVDRCCADCPPAAMRV